MTSKLRLGILGCGAITRVAHLPAALSHPEVELVALVDRDREGAQSLAKSRSIGCHISSTTEFAAWELDAVINALPNSLHAATTLQALEHGVHVLCEKPLAISSSDAEACAAMADTCDRILAVGMSRRFVGSHRVMHLLLQESVLGSSLGYSCSYGGEFDWKSASGFYFSKSLAGGGVLIDFGVHLLDSLVDWFGPVTRLEYQDDNWGSGIEANAILEVEHSGRYGVVEGKLQLSRTFPLRNRLFITGTEADAEISLADLDCVTVRRMIAGERVKQTMRLEDYPHTSSFYKQLDNFVQSIRGNEKPVVDGWQAAEILHVIESAYANAHRIPEPWAEVGSEILIAATEVPA